MTRKSKDGKVSNENEKIVVEEVTKAIKFDAVEEKELSTTINLKSDQIKQSKSGKV